MAKKKKGQKRKQSNSKATQQIVPDRRAIEGMMRQMLPVSGNASKTELAQEIVYHAFETDSPGQQIALANKALQVSADCADAYSLLAEHAETLPEALSLCEQAVAAGERALGEEGFRQYEGHFWGFLETRPYMRARERLADCLWAARRREEAVEHCRQLLRLNPEDNQGIRYRLCSMLLDLEQHEELEQLLQRFEQDEMAEWLYTRALLAFRQAGDSQRARQLLAEAHQNNKHVAAYVTGAQLLPQELPPHFAWGSEDEAILYAAQYLPAWRNTSGATSWMRKTLKVPLAPAPPRRQPSWGQLKTALDRLPQEVNDVWEVDLRPLEVPAASEILPAKPWALAIANANEGQMLMFDLLPERPKDMEVWSRLLEAMSNPSEDEPHRPGEIRIIRKTWFNLWKSKLEQIGVNCRLTQSLEYVEHFFQEVVSPEIFQQMASGPSAEEDWPDLAELPQHAGEIWQAEVRQLPTWIEVDGQPQRPWVLIVADVSNEFLLATEVLGTEPDEQWLWQGIRKAICAPAMGEPHLPGVVQVAQDEHRRLLALHLEPAGVKCVVSDDLAQIGRLFHELEEQIAGPRQQALIDSPGITTKQLGSLFAAAADFYRRAPWRHVPSDTVIQVECDRYESGPWHAVVMGQSGMQLGLALYEDMASLRAALSGDFSDEETARRTSAISLTFGEMYEIAPHDLDAAEQHGWPVAGPEAFPSVMRIKPGLVLRTPLTWELELLEGSLRAIVDFFQSDANAASLEVNLATGPLTLKLTVLDD